MKMEKFKRGTVIVGSDRQEKLSKLDEILKGFKKDEVDFVTHHHHGELFMPRFRVDNKDAKLVVIDNVKGKHVLHYCFCITEGMLVELQGEEPFKIHPEIVIILDDNSSRHDIPVGKSFQRRADVIYCDTQIVVFKKGRLISTPLTDSLSIYISGGVINNEPWMVFSSLGETWLIEGSDYIDNVYEVNMEKKIVDITRDGRTFSYELEGLTDEDMFEFYDKNLSIGYKMDNSLGVWREDEEERARWNKLFYEK